MPTYVYECKKCGYRFELLQSIADPPRQRCPKCRGAVKRLLMPGGGFIFKGSGFYITDYRNKETREKQRREKQLSKERGGAPKSSKSEGSAPSEKEHAKSGHVEQKGQNQRREESRTARSDDHAD